MAAYITTEKKEYDFFFYFNWAMEVIFFIRIATEFLTDY
jgi:hypothetical protein